MDVLVQATCTVRVRPPAPYFNDVLLPSEPLHAFKCAELRFRPAESGTVRG